MFTIAGRLAPKDGTRSVNAPRQTDVIERLRATI
jgi:hypothetical protein